MSADNRLRAMMHKESADEVYYEEPVIFYNWLFGNPRPVQDPLGIWIKVCSWGLRPVVAQFLLEAEYQAWLAYRAKAQRHLGERFIEDTSCYQNLRRSTDEQVEHNRQYWN